MDMNRNHQRLLVFGTVVFLLLLILGCSMSRSSQQNGTSEAALTEYAVFHLQQTETAIAASIIQPTQAPLPTYTFYPTYTDEPEPTDTPQSFQSNTGTEETDSQADVQEISPQQGDMELVESIEISGKEFYCNYEPNSITFTLNVTDINTGFALYYHFEEKGSGTKSDRVIEDIHRDRTETYRFLTLIGDPAVEPDYHSAVVTFPIWMGPSYLVYEIIADDGSFRTEKKSDIEYYPCSYVVP